MMDFKPAVLLNQRIPVEFRIAEFRMGHRRTRSDETRFEEAADNLIGNAGGG